MSGADRFLLRDTGPLKGLRPFAEREILDDLAVAEHEAIGKSSAHPFGRVFQADAGMKVYDDFISIRQELLGLAGPFGPSPAPFRDVRLNLRDTAIGAGRWKALGLDAHDLRIEIFRDRLHVIAIDRGEELSEGFRFGTHGLSFQAFITGRAYKIGSG